MAKARQQFGIRAAFSKIPATYKVALLVLVAGVVASLVITELLSESSPSQQSAQETITGSKASAPSPPQAMPTSLPSGAPSPAPRSSATPVPKAPAKPSSSPPASAPNVSHPTAADCGALDSKFSVYASIKTGTPAYKDHPIFRDSSNEVLYTISYGTVINNVFCDSEKTALFREVGRQIYARFNFQDVSLNPL